MPASPKAPDPSTLPRVALYADFIDGSPETLAVSISEACRIVGIGRSTLYEALARGEIEAAQAGRRTIVIVESLRRYVAALPRYRAGCGMADAVTAKAGRRAGRKTAA
ncbi:helix-turn-helix domain-containing protein [Neoroseomonas lacus]|uniref:Helix-turn-helix domain-containing protein n=1 Tax=Neoroseomonas lacus TaxID=287609 RepID=A0A917KGU4_9PROT|nr:helix-turn-helix domain-containing protein [Neoroseomonas lacus]GGJ10855.1 hypothetical protein GCM10011320_17420 [Neoroseomonas lacus]